KVKPRTGVFVAVVPWYTELAETYDGKDINQHLAGFGAQELGNLMTKAGFSVSGEECHSYHREWPSNYQFWYSCWFLHCWSLLEDETHPTIHFAHLVHVGETKHSHTRATSSVISH
ncbi:unnamed protein product, partial [Amoebophrya sp. A120]